MNLRVIANSVGLLTFFLSGAMLLSIPFSIYYNEGDLLGILLAVFISLLTGIILILIGKKKADIRIREGFAIVTFTWIIFALLGSLPYILTGSISNFTDAFFESMSGFTTTGSSILTDIESIPRGVLFWRATTQWLGGGGIIVLYVALLSLIGIGGVQLFQAETTGPVSDKIKPRIAETAKTLWKIYLIFTFVMCVALWLAGMDFYDSLAHTFTTLPTGGYSTKNTSVAAFDVPAIQWIIIFFMFVGAINFSLHYHMMHFRFKPLLQSTELKAFVFIIVVALIIIVFDVLNYYDNLHDALRHSLFQIASIGSSTGYATADYQQWNWSSQFIIFLLMFIGGMAGSTAGGLKIIRIYLLFKLIRTEIVKIIHPKAVIPVKFNGKIVESKTLVNVSIYFAFFILISLVSTGFITLFGIDPVTAFSSVIACLNNIGPGFGTIGPVDNFFHLPIPVKWILSFLMLVGRLEIFTVIILFVPQFWKK